MLHRRRTKLVRRSAPLSDVFEAVVVVERSMQCLLSYGVFDASGTAVDRLLAVLPKIVAPSTSTARPASVPISSAQSVLLYGHQLPEHGGLGAQ